MLGVALGILFASCGKQELRPDQAFSRAIWTAINQDTIKDGRIPPPAAGWQTGLPPPEVLISPGERKGALACPSPLGYWPAQHASRWSTEKRTVMYVTYSGWLSPEDILKGQFRSDSWRGYYKLESGSQQFGEDVRKGRRHITESWRFQALDREWDGVLYLLQSSDNTGTFALGYCAERPMASGTARSAFLEMLDTFDEVPRGGLEVSIEKGNELGIAINEWKRILSPAEVTSRLRHSRERAIAAIRAAPGADNSAESFKAIGMLEVFNEDGVRFGHGYSARDVVRDLEKAKALDPGKLYGYILGQAYFDLGEYDRAIETLEQSLRETSKVLPDEKGWFILGEAYRAKGETAKAIGAYDKAREAIQDSRKRTPGEEGRRKLSELEKTIDERLLELKR